MAMVGAQAQVALQRDGGALAVGHRSRLAALAQDAQHRELPVHVRDG